VPTDEPPPDPVPPVPLSTRLRVAGAVSAATTLATAGAAAAGVPCLLLWVHAAGLLLSPLVARGVHAAFGDRRLALSWGPIALASWLGAAFGWTAAGAAGAPAASVAAWALPPFLLVALALRARVPAAHPPRPLASALLALVSLLVAGVAGEIAFRAYQRQLYRSRTLAAASPWETLPGERIYGLKRNHQGRGEFMVDHARAVPYRTSSLGLRGGEVGPRVPGVHRVLALGDSYTFGWAVEEDQSYPRQTEALFAAAGRSVEVVNAGVPGYNTRQERALLAELLPVVRPDAVALGFAMNDAEPQMTVLPPPDETYACAGVWTWEASKRLWNLKLCPEGRPLPLRLLTPSQEFLPAYDPGSPKWARTEEALSGIAALCEDARVPLVVLVLPDFNRDFSNYPFGVIHQRLRDWGARRGVAVVDLLPLVAGADSEALRVAGDGHPNAAGQRLIAEALRAQLEARLR
jgi:lysophospholipase L1-like esterase